MSEQNTNTPAAETNSEPNNSTQAEPKNEVPYGRFQEVNSQKNEWKSKYQDLESKVSKMEAAQETARQETMKKNQEYEALYNEAHSNAQKLQEQNKNLQQDLGAFRQGLVEQLPEERRVYTEGMNMATLQKFVQEEQITANANKTDSSRAGTTAKGDMGGFSSYAEWAAKDPRGYEAANSVVGTNIPVAFTRNNE